MIISKWAGHCDSSVTMKTYVHPSDEDLQEGRQALAKIHHIDQGCDRLWEQTVPGKQEGHLTHWRWWP